MSKQWMVPLDTRGWAYAMVVANTKAQAEKLAREGQWEDLYGEEMLDWEVAGDAKPETEVE